MACWFPASSRFHRVARQFTLRAGNDTDEVKTVEDKMDHRSKRRLMNQVRAQPRVNPARRVHSYDPESSFLSYGPLGPVLAK